jgi:3',5'-nucleoside bisphosphate phosphatase
MMQKIDLHIHSYHSDGNLSPKNVVERGYAKGVETMAIVDHNSIDGIQEALQAGRRLGIIIIPGVEVAAVCMEIKIHLLIYDFDPENRILSQKLRQMRVSRDCHLERIAEKFQALGIFFSINEAMQTIKGSRLELYIAETVFQNPENKIRFQQEDIRTPDEFRETYLGVHMDRLKMSVQDIIELAHQARGKIFLAHPQSTLRRDFFKLIPRLISRLRYLGMDGIEVFHSENDERSTLALMRLAMQYRLLESAGSDFHGDHPPYPSHLRLGEWKNYGLLPNLSWLEEEKE